MPQVVDLESLVCGGGVCGDAKVACETTLPLDSDRKPEPEPYINDPDGLPAESYSLPLDLFLLDHINPASAIVYERDDSTKGTANPKSHLHQNHNHNNQAPSQRFSGNLKASAKAPIIGLPNKITHHSGIIGQSGRRAHHHHHSQQLFPQTRGAKLADPGSPQVSCFGKVLSERERSRRCAGGGSPGFWAKLLRCFGRRREEYAAPAEDAAAGRRGRDVPTRERRVAAAAAPVEPPGLGGMKRFVSGRRAASWGGDVEVDLGVDRDEDGHVPWSGPLVRQ